MVRVRDPCEFTEPRKFQELGQKTLMIQFLARVGLRVSRPVALAPYVQLCAFLRTSWPVLPGSNFPGPVGVALSRRRGGSRQWISARAPGAASIQRR